jgi:hypothetical protein
MSSTAFALATFKISITCRGRSFTRFQLIWVHTQAHRTSSATPFRAGSQENLIQTLGLCLKSNSCGAWDYQHSSIRSNLLPLDYCGRGPEILYSTISAGSEKDSIYFDRLHWRSGLQGHVIQGALGGTLLLWVGKRFWIRD